MLFRAQRPITRANYASRTPRPRQLLESELTIVGSAGEFGSFRAAPPTFRDVRFHFEEKTRSSVGKCGDAVVSSAGHQKNILLNVRFNLGATSFVYATHADGSPSAPRKPP